MTGPSVVAALLILLLKETRTALAQTSNCSICPFGSTIQNPNKSLSFIGKALTCQKGEDILSRVDANGCNNSIARFQRFPFDISTWCECSGSVEPPNVCSLCSRTPQGVLVNENLKVDLGNNVTVTCLEANELAPYIIDLDVCNNEYEVAVKDCCSGVPTAPIAPSPTSSPAPKSNRSTTTKSAAASTTRGRTMSVKQQLCTWGSLLIFLSLLVFV